MIRVWCVGAFVGNPHIDRMNCVFTSQQTMHTNKRIGEMQRKTNYGLSSGFSWKLFGVQNYRLHQQKNISKFKSLPTSMSPALKTLNKMKMKSLQQQWHAKLPHSSHTKIANSSKIGILAISCSGTLAPQTPMITKMRSKQQHAQP